MTKRKVLIPLDGSAFSRQVLAAVRAYVKPKDADLILLRVALPVTLPAEAIPVPRVPMSGGMALAASFEAYNRDLEQAYTWAAHEQDAYRQQLQSTLADDAATLRRAGYQVATEVLFGEPAEQIIDYATGAEVDLIAMTTHGRTGIGRFVLGSVAESVLRGVNVPVLLVRTSAATETFDQPADPLLQGLQNPRQLKVAVTTDGSAYGQQAVRFAGNLMQTLQAGFVVLVTVSDRDSAEYNQQVMTETVNLVGGLTPKPELTPLVGFTDETILEYLDKYPVDLLVVGAFRDRGAGSPKVIGATAQRIVHYAPASVLVVKGRASRLQKLLVCADVDDERLVTLATEFARRVGASVTLLHVAPPVVSPYAGMVSAGDAPADNAPADNAPANNAPANNVPLEEAMTQGSQLAGALKTWQAEFARHNLDPTQIYVRRGSVTETILEMAQAEQPDLIMVGSRSGHGHFHNTNASRIVSFAEQSVMVVRRRRE